ncbi:hypothetical protein LMH87_001830 [Akanthomyces muscarius]|uniref:Uncharacterized protein n=1 Tax=Akanthomyces muscarius TaxID=2231603 RepID=A0A9W8Q7K8_AKAMU|nr:hypothetical protein LMH87_001830 [Akanthomyces muscarius]KAJ4147296.1 hypothetical protein LMH87_001830 [Akanthomyces muscarius]
MTKTFSRLIASSGWFSSSHRICNRGSCLSHRTLPSSVAITMGTPSFQASNAIIYLTYGVFLVMGTGIAWKLRNQAKTDFLSSNGTQTAFPLALNFIASGE